MTDDAKAVWVAYGGALAVAVATALALEGRHPVAVALWADVAATVAIFACSVLYRNSSFYDAYWSVAPIAIALYWAFGADAADASPSASRQAVVIAGVAAWGVRLTWNWARGWEGLGHEDWRYVRIRERTGALYWPVSFVGIHAFPTLIVFAGCLPLYPALADGSAPWGWLDGAALAVMGGAIWLEWQADRELLRFRRGPRDPEAILRSGLWARSRHPNYLGEMGFWWGLWLFGLAADPGAWWTGVGALAITGMFVFVSLPLIETRMRERRPGYAAWAARTPLVVPWPRRKGRPEEA